jgi:hypothetical protein
MRDQANSITCVAISTCANVLKFSAREEKNNVLWGVGKSFMSLMQNNSAPPSAPMKGHFQLNA